MTIENIVSMTTEVSLLQNIKKETLQALSDSEQKIPYFIAIAGPAGAGVEGFAKKCCDLFGKRATTVSLNGFYYDSGYLKQKGMNELRGAPNSYNVDAFVDVIETIASKQRCTLSIYDDENEMVIAGDHEYNPDIHDIIVVEGSYLLYNHKKWLVAANFWDNIVFLTQPVHVLEKRLVEQYIQKGQEPVQAKNRVKRFELQNIQIAMNKSIPSDRYIVR